MKLEEAKKNFIFETKIELNDEGDFVELREPSQKEIMGLSDDSQNNLKVMESLFARCVVDSSFEREDGNKASGQEIYDVLKESGSLFLDVLTMWMSAIPFQSRLKKNQKSDK